MQSGEHLRPWLHLAKVDIAHLDASRRLVGRIHSIVHRLGRNGSSRVCDEHAARRRRICNTPCIWICASLGDVCNFCACSFTPYTSSL